jgi:DMSO/TMAO reductase YedYZ molybdopterin-dependent catalytic subunit
MRSEFLGLNIDAPPGADRTTESERALAAGLGAGAASFLLSVLLRALFGTPLMPERVADFIFSVMPIAAVELGVALLGPYAKRFAFAGCVLACLAVLAYAGLLYAKRWGPRPAHGLAFGGALWLASSVTVVPLIGGGIFGTAWRPGPWASAGSLLAAGLAYGACLAALLGALGRDEALARRGAALATRRAVLRALAVGGFAVVAYEALKSAVAFIGWGEGARVSGGSGIFPDIDGLSREVTPVSSFYHVSKNVFDPDGPPPDWRLEVAGLVERPRAYTIEELRALPAAEAYATLACISNWVGGDLMGNALWRGVPLGAILGDAGIREGAVDVVFTALDDYTDSLPVERAVQPGSLLAYEMNGEPLDATHGSPLRAIVPGIYGMKNVKWIRRIEVVASDYKGYWQRRGWDDRAEYQTMSRVDVARAGRAGEPAVAAGIAFAGDRGISRVEVSTDGGRTWGDAEVRPPLSPNCWALWQFTWTPSRAGGYRVVARATDGRGQTQTERRAPPAPSGATGWHGVDVTVSEA